jgi:hypothetical protein
LIEKTIDGVKIFDGRESNPRPPKFSGKRSWPLINGVVLHQAAANGCHPRVWPKIVNAHIGIRRNGHILLLQPWDHTIWSVHDNPTSKRTISVEIEGSFCGTPDDPATQQIREDLDSHWGNYGPHELTAEQEDAAGVLFFLLHREFKAQGAEWRRILAHRQTAGSRPSCPGWEAWQRIALPWQAALSPHLKDTRDWSVPYGKPIPGTWDPTSPHPY